LPAAPLMHGTSTWFSMPVLCRAGSVTTLVGRHLDAVEVLDAIVSGRINGIAIVGDAFARPLLAELDRAPARWDLDSLRVVFSSGAMLSADAKAALMRHAPNATIVDGLGSSESGFIGRAVVRPGGEPSTAHFVLSPDARVIDDDGNDVVPGSGQRGRLAVRGHLPLGYHNDAAKTAQTFVLLDGVRHVVAGDWAEVTSDGEIHLLGRGSECINTGGEKVFPEEVEEALKTHPAVVDAVVVGEPDERFGERVVAVVQLRSTEPGDDELRGHVRLVLAGYKVPKRIVRVPEIARGANGKVDYKRVRAAAASGTSGTAS
ncbi:MAG: 3-oxocholest-4-en-26-oate---CoA ligase, partial [Acidimicrobiaceae bacterium]